MNDFTKEELEDLHICCNGGVHDDHPLEDWKIALQEKIQCLIDNYCEHNLAVYIGPNGTKVSCQKCKKEFQ